MDDWFRGAKAEDKVNQNWIELNYACGGGSNKFCRGKALI